MTTPSPNGHQPAADPMADAVYANYQQLGRQLQACLILLGALPLAHMVTANRRLQSTSVLTLPAGTTADQAAAVRASLQADERVLTAAVKLQQTMAAVSNGH